MDLKDILEKNKHKVLKLTSFKMPEPPSIAIEDRPYNIDFKENIHVTDSKQKGNKQVTNGKQTGNKRETNGKQTGNKQVTKKHPIIQNGKQTGNKQVTERVTDISINRKQTGNSHPEKISFTRLVGIQRTILLFFYFLAKRNISQSTNPVTMDHISQSLNITKGVAKTTIIRLQKKGCLTRHLGKEGRGGWSSFTITSELYQDMMQQEKQGFLDSLFHQTGNKQVTEQVTEQVTKLPSSSSLYITTTTEREADDFKINLEPLNGIGLTHSHLIQLTKKEILTPQQIQDSIDCFAFDLEHNEKAKTLKKTPLDFFMGILRQGMPYAAPNNYESKRSASMRLYLKSKEIIEKNEKAIEEKFKNILLQEWLDHLTPSELMEFYLENEAEPELESLPEKIKITFKKRNALKNAAQYFEMEIFPSKRKEILSSQSAVEEEPQNK